MKTALTFQNVKPKDLPVVGKKAYVLAGLYNAGLPVPKGFVITTDAFFEFLNNTDARIKISNIISLIETGSYDLSEISRQIQKHILDTPLPSELEEEIVDLYISAFDNHANKSTDELIGESEKNPSVAVRISYNDRAPLFLDYSPHYLNVKGKDKLIRIIKVCWASMFDRRVIEYREKENIDHLSISCALIVQEMIDPIGSAIFYSLDKMDDNISDDVTAEFPFMRFDMIKGFSDPMKRNEFEPDVFHIDRKTKQITHTRSNTQNWGYFIEKETKRLTKSKIMDADKLLLEFDEIADIIGIANKVELYFKMPQEIEFIIDRNKVYILESKTIDNVNFENILQVLEQNNDQSNPSNNASKGASDDVLNEAYDDVLADAPDEILNEESNNVSDDVSDEMLDGNSESVSDEVSDRVFDSALDDTNINAKDSASDPEIMASENGANCTKTDEHLSARSDDSSYKYEDKIVTKNLGGSLNSDADKTDEVYEEINFIADDDPSEDALKDDEMVDVEEDEDNSFFEEYYEEQNISNDALSTSSDEVIEKNDMVVDSVSSETFVKSDDEFSGDDEIAQEPEVSDLDALKKGVSELEEQMRFPDFEKRLSALINKYITINPSMKGPLELLKKDIIDLLE